MTNQDRTFAIDRGHGRFLAAYFPVGDPRLPLSRLGAYDRAGVDVVELGLKARDPFADGAVIRASMDRASGIGTLREAREAIAAVSAFDRATLPLVFAYAEAGLAAAPGDWTGVDALLCLGRDPDARRRTLAEARARGTRIVKYVPHAAEPADIAEAVAADAYVMLQYSAGPTGLRDEIDATLPGRLRDLRAAGVARPILTGVGISTGDQVAHAIASGADGVVLGSMTVTKALESAAAVEDYLGRMREILDG